MLERVVDTSLTSGKLHIMNNRIIGLKDLRVNMGAYIAELGKGKSFTVVRRTKPVFIISSPQSDVDGQWETVVDFTRINKRGVLASDVLTMRGQRCRT